MSVVHGQIKESHLGEPREWFVLRETAQELAAGLPFPNKHDEAWRFIDLSPLKKIEFQADLAPSVLTIKDIARWSVPEACARLVFVDGVYAPTLSQPKDTALSLKNAFKHYELIAQHLGRYAPMQGDIFAAQNTSLWRDGAFVFLEKSEARPVHLLFVTTQKQLVTYPRVLIVAANGVQGSVIENYVAADEQVYFSNCVTEVVLQDNAILSHTKIQREAKSAFHINNCAVQLASGSTYKSQTISLGARLSRQNLKITQKGEGAHAELDGLALIGGRQTADTHTQMDHAKPYGTSTQLHKCIIDGAAHAVFNGIVYVREGAQLTNSAQSSRNLLLSDKAHVDTKPQLEIFADDVKCAHGATVGQLDADELFYLKSRGLDETTARKLLTYAFAAEIIDKIPVDSIVQSLRHTVFEQTQNAAAL